ncbi:MAG: hypothetical protein E6997_02580 [Citrobacter sp.]|uniref:hypothetical protein n=1 Tax=Citrobacter braakii TaxID=57706 RepID=UPI0019050B8A|nr:hypothetical protein [Citrobacter braakii]MBJ8954395.1 hypothetical protein [Citrobacter braakii]MDU1181885.1 hypothetical protein [Citrobacter sp.]
MNRDNVIYICESAKKYWRNKLNGITDSDFPNKNYEKHLKIYNAKIKVDKLKRALKPTIGLSCSYWSEPVNIFAKKHLESIFSMRDITRTFKILAGMFHFTENEKDIVSQHTNKSMGKTL